MTRFDADEPTERRKLFADAVTAHRTRGSAFLTVEAREPEQAVAFGANADAGTEDGAIETGDDAETAADTEADETSVPPWVQFADKTFNLDCTDEELDRLEGLLNDYPEFRIDQLEEPEDVHGTNVRISARADANRLAQFADEVFQTVYGRDEDYRAWVVAV